MNQIITVLLRNSKRVFAFTFLICLCFSYYSKYINIEAKSTSFFLENDKDLQLFNNSLKTFGEQNFLVLAYKANDDIFSKDNIEKLQNIEKELLNLDGVRNVLSILNAPLFLSGAGSINNGANLDKARNEISNNKFYIKNLISDDFLVCDFLVSATNADDIIPILKDFSQKHNLILGGMNVIASDMITYVKDDLYTYGLGLFILLSIAIFIFFRSFYFVFVCMFICLVSLFTTTGVLALLNYNITVISSNYVALVLIITISVIVHILTHFAELLQKNHISDNTTKVRHTLLTKARPSFYAILTTVVGFMSLVFSGIKPISELGIMMSVGISISLVLCYLFLPFLLLNKKDNKKVHFFNNSNFLLFCANTAIKRRKIVYVISVFIIVFSVFAVPKLSVENSFVNYFKDSSNIKQGLLLIDEKLGGTLPLDIIVKFNDESDESDEDFSEFLNQVDSNKYYLTPTKLEILGKIHKFLEEQKYIGSVLSLYPLLDFAKKINNDKEIDGLTLSFLQVNLSDELKKQIISPYYNENSKELRLAIRIVDSDKTLKRAEFLYNLRKNLDNIGKDYNISIQVSGVMILYNNMLSSLVHSQIDTLEFVILSIFALFLIIFRNLRFSIIGIISNIIPISLLFAILGFSGLSLDLMSVTIAAISIGMGVDAIIHYVHRFKEEIKKNTLDDAIRLSHLSIGSALYYTTFTIVLGFCLMMSSNFMPTIYFGLLTVMVMVLLLFGSLFLLPSLMISFYFNGYFKNEYSKKGLKC